MRNHPTQGMVMALLLVLLSGCAISQSTKPLPYRLTPEGVVIWEDEYAFSPPPSDWKVLRVEDESGDINFGFTHDDGGPFPSVTTMAYDEDPFGCSPGFENREREFFKRFLFNAILQFQVLERRRIQVLGGEGKDPVKGEKVRARVVFGKRGERIVGFYITQWRPIDRPYDLSLFEVFDRFVKSFRFLKKSFYETL